MTSHGMTKNGLTSEVLDSEGDRKDDLYMMVSLDCVCVNVGEPAEWVTHERQVSCCEDGGQLRGDMTEHVVVFGPFGVCCINVETSSFNASCKIQK